MDKFNCLHLNEDPIQFDPASVSKTTNVFYDEITEQVNIYIFFNVYNYKLFITIIYLFTF